MKYQRIVRLKKKGHSVRKSCHFFKVSPPGFYQWLIRTPSECRKRDQNLKQKISNIFEWSKRNYGSPRIHKALQTKGEKVGRYKVAQLMRESGLSARKKKAFRPRTTLNHPSSKKSPRIFKIEDFKIDKENKIWVSDLTYLPSEKGFCYLVVVMDLFNREIKGWDVSHSMDAENTKKAFLGAVKKTPGKLDGLIFHSDQGVQYCSSVMREKLEVLNITQSMSRKGNCYDNAFAESFFHSLKNELEKTRFKDLPEAKSAVFEYLNWYNRERLHSSLEYLSPIKYSNKSNCHVA